MAAPDLRGLIQVGFDILNTSVDPTTSKILAQIGDAHAETTAGDSVEWWQQTGFASRPSKPTAGKTSAQGVIIRSGDHDLCVASQDTRCLDRYALLKAGESCVYAAGENGTSQARTLWKSDGSITHYTTDTNATGGKSIYARVGTGTSSIGAPDGHSWVGPWGTTKFDNTGFHVVHLSGSELHIGGIYGLPAPLDSIASYVKIAAGTVHLECSSLSVGIGACQPLALQLPTLAMITALQTEIIALQAEIAALQAHNVAVGASVTPAEAALPTYTAAAAAVVAGVAAVAVCATTLAAQALLQPATSSST